MNAKIETYKSDGTDGYNAGFFGYIVTTDDEKMWTDGGYASERCAQEAAEQLAKELTA